MLHRASSAPITHPDALRLIEEVQAEYVVRYGGPDETPLDPLMFEPPPGSFFVGYARRRARSPPAPGGAATTSRRSARRRTAEIKRMYVVPAARGAGWPARMLAHLEATAAEAGAEAMILETGTAQPEAIALYESSGYDADPGVRLLQGRAAQPLLRQAAR